jgi:hypothetical protein
MKPPSNGSRTTSLGAIVGCCALLLAGFNVSSANADTDFGAQNANACVNAIGFGGCGNQGPAPQTPSGPTLRVDPCFIAQNAMRPCNTTPPAPAPPIMGVDPHLLGTWYIPAGNGYWVFDIFSNGTYKFRSEAGDGLAPGEGIFAANNGRWGLRATTGYMDGGTYLFRAPDEWIATGRLGTGAWHRNALDMVLRR